MKEQPPGGRHDVLVARFEQLEDPEPFLSSPFSERDASFSPDGRWIAYQSNETGRREIYVRAYPGPGRTWPISRQGGGREPLWSRDGQEIFFRNGDRMMTVVVDTRQGFAAGPPRLLFELGTAADAVYLREYDATPDAQRFVMVRRTSPKPSRTHFNLVLNWFEELKQLVPTDQ